MKSKLFKTVLPAFALILAISASLAFTPAENITEEEDIRVTISYYQITDEYICCEILDIECETTFTPFGFCTVTIVSTVYRLYAKDVQGKCNVTLYNIDPC